MVVDPIDKNSFRFNPRRIKNSIHCSHYACLTKSQMTKNVILVYIFLGGVGGGSGNGPTAFLSFKGTFSYNIFGNSFGGLNIKNIR